MRLSATVALVALFAGCTSLREYVANGFKVGPNYSPPRASVADAWIDQRDANVSTRPPNDAQWWNALNDPTLDWLVEASRRENLSLRIACFRIVEARAQRAVVAGNLFPQTQQAAGSYTRNQLSRNVANQVPELNYNDWTVGATLAWEIDFWGLYRRALESADAQVAASIYNYGDALVLLLSEVAQSYVDVRTAEARLNYARKNVEDQKVSLQLAQVKYNNGATTRLDVTQGESNLAQTEAAIPPLEAARRQAANQLCILMAMPPRDLDAALGRRDIPAVSPMVAVGIPADLLCRRPDVRRAEREAAAQSAQIGVATAALYPHLSISGTIFYDAERFQQLFEPGSLGGSVGPSFTWNILNYGRLVGGINVQDARFQQLVLRYQNTVLQANAEAENALVGFLQAQQQVGYLATSVRAAEESLSLVRIQYNEGKTDFNRVVNVEQLLTQQEDQLAVARGSVAGNLILLYKALGGGWQIPNGTGSAGGAAPPAPPLAGAAPSAASSAGAVPAGPVPAMGEPVPLPVPAHLPVPPVKPAGS
jgi:NodT family efflux transporter outer membrane factor (OMF) lipoprotein